MSVNGSDLRNSFRTIQHPSCKKSPQPNEPINYLKVEHARARKPQPALDHDFWLSKETPSLIGAQTRSRRDSNSRTKGRQFTIAEGANCFVCLLLPYRTSLIYCCCCLLHNNRSTIMMFMMNLGYYKVTARIDRNTLFVADVCSRDTKHDTIIVIIIICAHAKCARAIRHLARKSLSDGRI